MAPNRTPSDYAKPWAKGNLQRMLANIPLTDDQRAGVDDGQTALDQLVERLTGIPTPAGPTARQPGGPANSAPPGLRLCCRSST